MPHYFSEKQESELNLKKIFVRLSNDEFELYTASGIFSKDGLDIGSELLIENSIIKEGWSILDLGCGNGIVGISLKRKYPGIKVVMSDINERAVMLADKNIKLHNLEGIKVVKSDVFSEVDERFNTILLNPPQTAGRELCYRMIIESREHLLEGGMLQLVARHNKGGRTLMEKMAEVYGNAEHIAVSSGFRVYMSIKKSPGSDS